MPTNYPGGLLSRGVPVEDAHKIPLGVNEVYWVDGTNGDDTNQGKTLGKAFKTVEKFFAVDAARDVCIIMPGTYAPATASLPLTPLANTKLIAAIPAIVPNVIITDDGGGSDTDLMDIEVDNFTLDGIMLQAAHADVARLIKIADTEDVAGLNLLNCWFDAAGFATVNGVSAIDATKIITGMLIEGSHFEECDVGLAIGVKGMKNSFIRGNYFDMQDGSAGDIGITLADTTSSAIGYGFWIHDNWFLGPPDAGADAIGIVITDASGEDTTGIGLISRNNFAYCNVAAISPDKMSKGQTLNYVGAAANGATVVSPGS